MLDWAKLHSDSGHFAEIQDKNRQERRRWKLVSDALKNYPIRHDTTTDAELTEFVCGVWGYKLKVGRKL